MDDLITFINARLDEDEAAAKAADPGPWKSTAPSLYVDAPGIGIIVQTRHFEDAEHIARHDPARTLREVAAKRAIVAEHWPVDPCDAHDASARTIPCDTLLHVAAVWSDHPDYQPGWAQ